ncbi:MAG: nucleotidyl transferase AbiEii/AbiGii toxin family protein [Candidatus Melainabacteria bacterium]|nr:MAG: nucleotidyl transferase AbiEii/AbiGii toxin family protein [Candidatus Melainabacteria bacterium]
MDSNSPYAKQVALLMRVLPIAALEKCFALKGGTAINLFVRDMPRLSVDIDLAYLPVLEREESLSEISASLGEIRKKILELIPGSKVNSLVLRGADKIVKLVIRTSDAQVKIEVTPVLRGTVFPSQTRVVSKIVQEKFGFAETTVVSFADLYGGKIVAALDRQHPRDLYDVRLLLANEGIDRDLFQAFLVYLISHDRPMSEIISPKFKDIRQEFEQGFSGMAFELVSREDLEQTREELVEKIKNSFTENDKRLLLSIKRGEPQWDLLDLKDVDKLPAVRWKLQNLENLKPEKRAELLERLTNCF